MFYRAYQRGRGPGEPGGEHDPWVQAPGAPFVIVSRRPWSPPTDVYETAAAVVIKLELAGVREADMSIAITGETLTVQGLRRDNSAAHKIGYHHLGITYGEFRYDIGLPGPVNRDAIDAAYDSGFLTITLPKTTPQVLGPVQVQVQPPNE